MRRKKRKGTGITEKRLLSGCALLLAGAVLTVMSGELPGMAEWYSTHIYPVMVQVIGRAAGIFPFSLSEAGIVRADRFDGGLFYSCSYPGGAAKTGRSGYFAVGIRIFSWCIGSGALICLELWN
ncbi:MAG: hypothetical protein QM793_05050 [Muricomes sp.]